VYCKYVKKYVSRKEELEIAKSKRRKLFYQESKIAKLGMFWNIRHPLVLSIFSLTCNNL
jgi:hypothetical protein